MTGMPQGCYTDWEMSSSWLGGEPFQGKTGGTYAVFQMFIETVWSVTSQMELKSRRTWAIPWISSQRAAVAHSQEGSFSAIKPDLWVRVRVICSNVVFICYVCGILFYEQIKPNKFKNLKNDIKRLRNNRNKKKKNHLYYYNQSYISIFFLMISFPFHTDI